MEEGSKRRNFHPLKDEYFIGGSRSRITFVNTQRREKKPRSHFSQTRAEYTAEPFTKISPQSYSKNGCHVPELNENKRGISFEHETQ
jgi:hypothetical protein